MTSKVQPSPEPYAELLSERSASLNRADFISKPRDNIRRDDDAMENLLSTENLCLKATAHHRHTALGGDSRSLALHPINLNFKFEEFCSSQFEPSHGKASTKISILSGLTADKESNSFVSAALSQKEDEVVEPPEELSLEPHENLMQDAQEEALFASLSIDSTSPDEEQDFVLWGNPAFCLSEGRARTGSSVQRQRDITPEKSTRCHSQISKQNQSIECLKLPSRDHTIQPGYHLGTAVSSLTFKTHHVSLVENEENVRPRSSVGSTFSHNLSSTASTTRHVQAQAWEDLSKESCSISFDAQSCCLDFDAQELEASSASDCADREAKVNEVPSKQGEDQGTGVLPQVTHDEGDISTTSPANKLYEDESIAADEEIKIRAELELEIERDLEQEIKTKIYLLTCRLEELLALKATRQPKQGETDSQKVAIEEKDDLLENEHVQAMKEAMPNLTTENDLKRSSIEQGQTCLEAEKTVGCQSLASSKKQPLTAGIDGQLSYINTPVTIWKKWAVSSGSGPHTKENKSSSEVTLKAIKTPRNCTEGSATILKSKVNVEGTSSYKHDYQNWTNSAASSKKFDWMRTLRSDFPSTPRVSAMKLGVGSPKSNAASVPAVEKGSVGHVARTLFGAGTSTSAKAVSKLERRNTDMSVSTGKRKSVVSSCKPHGTTLDVLLPTTPHTRSTTSAMPASASAKRVSQRPLDQRNRDTVLVQKSHLEPTRQVRTITPATKPTSVPRASPRQVSSGKLGKREKTSNVRVSPPSKQASTGANSVSFARTVKPTRSSPAVSSTPHSVISKGSPTVVTSRASPKQASCLQQISNSRVATSLKMASSATQANKEMLLTSGTPGRRQAGAKSKAPGSSMRRKAHEKVECTAMDLSGDGMLSCSTLRA